MCEVAGDFDGVGRAAKVWIHPVGTCRQHGVGDGVGVYVCGEEPRAQFCRWTLHLVTC